MTAFTVGGMVSAARSQIESLSPTRVSDEISSNDVVLIDIREPEERAASGTIPGAMHAARGMLEFYADATSPYYRPEFETDRRIILFCASGGRSALATATLRQLGFTRVAHLDGGLKAWAAAGNPVTNA